MKEKFFTSRLLRNYCIIIFVSVVEDIRIGGKRGYQNVRLSSSMSKKLSDHRLTRCFVYLDKNSYIQLCVQEERGGAKGTHPVRSRVSKILGHLVRSVRSK